MEVFAWRMAQVVHLDNHTLHHAHAAAGGSRRIRRSDSGQPYSPNFSERNAYGQKQQQQIGYGSGFGLTGGGAIGLAESLPGLAAGAAAAADAAAPAQGDYSAVLA
jgi:hypothetical protein